MEGDLIPTELRIQFNYDAVNVHVINIDTGEKITEVGAIPAGVEWYVELYICFREKHRMLLSRVSIERMLMDIGTVMPEEYPQRTLVMRGRNLDTGLPDAIEMSTSTIYEIIQPLLSALPQNIEAHLTSSLYSDTGSPTARHRSFYESLGDVFQGRGLTLQYIALQDGDFPLLKGFDQYLRDTFGVPVQRANVNNQLDARH